MGGFLSSTRSKEVTPSSPLIITHQNNHRRNYSVTQQGVIGGSSNNASSSNNNKNNNKLNTCTTPSSPSPNNSRDEEEINSSPINENPLLNSHDNYSNAAAAIIERGSNIIILQTIQTNSNANSDDSTSSNNNNAGIIRSDGIERGIHSAAQSALSGGSSYDDASIQQYHSASVKRVGGQEVSRIADEKRKRDGGGEFLTNNAKLNNAKRRKLVLMSSLELLAQKMEIAKGKGLGLVLSSLNMNMSSSAASVSNVASQNDGYSCSLENAENEDTTYFGDSSTSDNIVSSAVEEKDMGRVDTDEENVNPQQSNVNGDGDDDDGNGPDWNDGMSDGEYSTYGGDDTASTETTTVPLPACSTSDDADGWVFSRSRTFSYLPEKCESSTTNKHTSEDIALPEYYDAEEYKHPMCGECSGDVDPLLVKYGGSTNIPSCELYAPAEVEVMPMYMAELAKSGRSICQYCCSTIDKGSMRVGSLDRISGSYGKWYHSGCWTIPKSLLDGSELLGVAGDVPPASDEADSVEYDPVSFVNTDNGWDTALDTNSANGKVDTDTQANESTESTPVSRRTRQSNPDASKANNSQSIPVSRRTRLSNTGTSKHQPNGRISTPSVTAPRYSLRTRKKTNSKKPPKKSVPASSKPKNPRKKSATLSFKKNNSLRDNAVMFTGRPAKFSSKKEMEQVAKLTGAKVESKHKKVEMLFVLQLGGNSESTQKMNKCTNATEHNEDNFIQFVLDSVSNFPPGLSKSQKLDKLKRLVAPQPKSASAAASSLSSTKLERKEKKFIFSGQCWNHCTNTGVDPNVWADPSAYSNELRPCCQEYLALTPTQEDEGFELNPQTGFPPLKFEKKPVVSAFGERGNKQIDICILKGCFGNSYRTFSINGKSCLHGCCLGHTTIYGEEGPPEQMKRARVYAKSELEVEESRVTTHGIEQVVTRKRVSTADPWTEEIKYYNRQLKEGFDRCICIQHGNVLRKCGLGCKTCEHGIADHTSKCAECHPRLKCDTTGCDLIKLRHHKICAWCMANQTGNLTTEQYNIEQLRIMGNDLTPTRYVSHSNRNKKYFVDGTAKGTGYFDELNYENDEGTFKEGHHCRFQYPTEAHHQRMEDIHFAKEDQSKGTVFLRANSAYRRGPEMKQQIQNLIIDDRLKFYSTATSKDTGGNNVIEYHDYDLSSRHVQRSLEMRWNGGKNDGVYHVRVFRQVPNLDEDKQSFTVEQAFEEVEYERNNNGEWLEK